MPSNSPQPVKILLFKEEAYDFREESCNFLYIHPFSQLVNVISKNTSIHEWLYNDPAVN